MISIGLAGALLGGLLSLISPCSALLLPSFFAYAFTGVRSLITRTAVFYLGLAAVLVPLGAGIGALGSLMTVHRETLTTIGGLVMIAFGVLVAVGRGFRLPGVAPGLARLRIGSTATVLALGALYGLAGFCAGPLLGGVLTVALAGGSAAYGGLLIAVYALGMAAPLFLLALAWDKFRLGERRWLRGRAVRIGPLTLHSTNLVGGALLIGIGVLFLTTAGTAAIGGPVGTDTYFDLQVWLSTVSGAVGDATVLFAAAVAVLAILVARLIYRSRRPASAGPKR